MTRKTRTRPLGLHPCGCRWVACALVVAAAACSSGDEPTDVADGGQGGSGGTGVEGGAGKGGSSGAAGKAGAGGVGAAAGQGGSAGAAGIAAGGNAGNAGTGGAGAPPWAHGPVRASGHGLAHADGTPFLWLADTFWKLNRKTDAQVKQYLDDRSGKGFSVVQVFVSTSWSIEDANGDRPFANDNPTQLDPSYFGRWSSIVDEAAARGLYLSLHIGEPARDDTPFHLAGQDQAYEYGRQVGVWFKAKPNVLYNLGQDQRPDQSGGIGVDGYRAIAEGIADGTNGESSHDGQADYTTTFMTFHPDGGAPSSSEWFHGDDWLDMNGMEVWGRIWDVYGWVKGDYDLTPVQPTCLVEGSYEGGDYNGHPVSPLGARIQAFHSYMAGGFHTYGHFDHWEDWFDFGMLDSEGARSMQQIGKLLRDQEWFAWQPDQSLISSGEGSGETRKVAVLHAVKNLALVYFPDESAAGVQLDKMNASSSVHARWWSPLDGKESEAGEHSTAGVETFAPPAGWGDAVLILVGT